MRCEQQPAPSRPTSPTPVPLSAVAARLGGRAAERGAGRRQRHRSLPSRPGRSAPGDLYAALPGARTHGARFAGGGRRRRSGRVLTDAEGRGAARRRRVCRSSSSIAPARARLAGRARLRRTRRGADPVGVTGTQGKTTTTQLVNAGVRGSRSAYRGDRHDGHLDRRSTRWKSALTTPEAPDLHALFAVMRERGVEVCAMEVSSHALVMGRVDGVVFDLAVFTNLGRDHLDFHADIEDYFAAKAELFTPARARRGPRQHRRRVRRTAAPSTPQIPTRTFARRARPPTGGCARHRRSTAERLARSTLDGPDGSTVRVHRSAAGRVQRRQRAGRAGRDRARSGSTPTLRPRDRRA